MDCGFLLREIDAACGGGVELTESLVCSEGIEAIVCGLAIKAGTRYQRLIDLRDHGTMFVFMNRGDFVSFSNDDRVFASSKSLVAMGGGWRRFQFSPRPAEVKLICFETMSPFLNLFRRERSIIRDTSVSEHPEFEELWALADTLTPRADAISYRFAQFYSHAMRLVASPDAKMCLAKIPSSVTGPMIDVAKKVRMNPELEWTTLTGASVSGYSQHHFSRMFKAQIGVGFHDFVEQARTTPAINMLMEGAGTIEYVARQIGFSSSSAMRDAIRKHTGFLPSDFSSVAHVRV